MPLGAILFVGVAFTLAVLSGGKGWLFVGSMVAAAGVLIIIVFVMAFSSGRGSHVGSPEDRFAALDGALWDAAGSPVSDGAGERDATGLLGEQADDDQARAAARALVRTLVPGPRAPPTLTGAADRREFLASLRREGAELIRLGRLAGTDLAPYQDLLADARTSAQRGREEATLRALQLANELLRASVEKSLVKRRSTGIGTDDSAQT